MLTYDDMQKLQFTEQLTSLRFEIEKLEKLAKEKLDRRQESKAANTR